MFTFVPGCCFSNSLFALATTVGQPDCASTCSQTVMLLADAFFVEADVAVTTARATTSPRPRATIERLFIWKPPESRRACRSPRAVNRPCESPAPLVGQYQIPLLRMVSQR